MKKVQEVAMSTRRVIAWYFVKVIQDHIISSETYRLILIRRYIQTSKEA